MSTSLILLLDAERKSHDILGRRLSGAKTDFDLTIDNRFIDNAPLPFLNLLIPGCVGLLVQAALKMTMPIAVGNSSL
jgi:hypothetical protein